MLVLFAENHLVASLRIVKKQIINIFLYDGSGNYPYQQDADEIRHKGERDEQ